MNLHAAPVSQTARSTSPPGEKRIVLAAPTFIGEPHVAEALESLLQQAHRDFVLIVCDDASTDATAAIVDRYSRSDEGLLWRPSSRRLGHARNSQRRLPRLEP
jgi:glycosyltransferase involved in cell wall biosynthesis